jgi:hypothetical protein
MDARSYLSCPKEGIFTSETINSFAGQSKRLNEEQKGDQAAFVLAPQ